MARAAVDGVYSGTAQQIAEHCYGLRGPAGKSSDSQISKFSNFNTVAMACERRGIELVEALVQRTEGTGNRYRIVQLVLVVLKKRLRAKAVMPSLEELAEMLADAQAPKTRKTRKSAATEASTGELSDKSTDASPGPSLSDHFVRGLDALLRNSNTPPEITAKCRDIKSYVEKTTAEFCSVSKTSERSADDPLAIPDHLDRREPRPLRAGSLKGDVT
jgi:hypothetical protein